MRVARILEKRDTFRLLVGKREGKRFRGRPTVRCARGILLRRILKKFR